MEGTACWCQAIVKTAGCWTASLLCFASPFLHVRLMPQGYVQGVDCTYNKDRDRSCTAVNLKFSRVS